MAVAIEEMEMYQYEKVKRLTESRTQLKCTEKKQR